MVHRQAKADRGEASAAKPVGSSRKAETSPAKVVPAGQTNSPTGTAPETAVKESASPAISHTPQAIKAGQAEQVHRKSQANPTQPAQQPHEASKTVATDHTVDKTVGAAVTVEAVTPEKPQTARSATVGKEQIPPTPQVARTTESAPEVQTMPHGGPGLPGALGTAPSGTPRGNPCKTCRPRTL